MKDEVEARMHLDFNRLATILFLSVVLAVSASCRSLKEIPEEYCPSNRPCTTVYERVYFSRIFHGTVTNEQGIPVQGACIKLWDKKDRLVGFVKSDQKGEFIMPGIPRGRYKFTVEAEGGACFHEAYIRIQRGFDDKIPVELHYCLDC